MTTVSAIIPSYNHGRFVIEAIESALSQTYPHIEIIIVDDGSVDDTARKLVAFGNRIRTIRQENQGLSAARNTGIRYARGEYVAFLDADDLWLPGFVESQVANLQRSPDVGLTFSWWRHIDEHGDLLPELGRYEGRGDLLIQLSLMNHWPPVSVMVRKRCIEEAGYFDGQLTALEDWDLWLRIAANGWHFDYVPHVLAEYRHHGKNMTLDVARMERNQLAVLTKLEMSSVAPRVAHLMPYARANVHLNSALSYYLQKKGPESYGALVKAIQIWPPLLACEETWYRWICADQPPGYRDTAYFRDLVKAAERISILLERLFADPDVAPLISTMRKEIEYVTGVMLAEHQYRENDLTAVRQSLLTLIRRDPTKLAKPQILRLLLRSLVGKVRIDRFRRLMTTLDKQQTPL